jgi:hypothetical protein
MKILVKQSWLWNGQNDDKVICKHVINGGFEFISKSPSLEMVVVSTATCLE